jgi:diguanylate cyclase (GGDEF)-like protein
MVDDPHVSRLHAELKAGEEGVVIKDLGSTNGIFVNGKKIEEQLLVDGDKVLVGTRLYFRFSYQDALDQDYQQNLFRAANIDGLTQVYNKKYFLDILAKEFSYSKRSGEPLSLMLIDLDHFKKINDSYGHIAGDLVLKTMGQHLLKSIRLENIACRYGGEEFAVIFRKTHTDLAYTVAERLRKLIESEKIPYLEHSIQTSVSIGIATYHQGNFALMDDLIRQADTYLYEAKRAGRNQTLTSTHRPAA